MFSLIKTVSLKVLYLLRLSSRGETQQLLEEAQETNRRLSERAAELRNTVQHLECKIEHMNHEIVPLRYEAESPIELNYGPKQAPRCGRCCQGESEVETLCSEEETMYSEEETLYSEEETLYGEEETPYSEEDVLDSEEETL
ncbi:hypothetical protein AAF712_015389 [Marasmius tenuissimus]|uniref:Uncharacterized protein n=1 Tax=Marasmius tenuissimus TaxID=585030 RepID=A0ABR2Z9R1_9AGAR